MLKKLACLLIIRELCLYFNKKLKSLYDWDYLKYIDNCFVKPLCTGALC
jgi:hypothetical protein